MYDIIIIGAGPAGLTAGIYSIRAGKKTLILEGTSIGGQIASSPRVENYPAIKQISGATLADQMYTQAEELGVEFDFDIVKNVEIYGNIKKVICEYNTYECKSLIIATGAKHRSLGALNEDKFVGNGIGYCVVCDGDFYAGKDVAIIGGGNTALQSALYLSNICKSVKIFQLLDYLTGEKKLIEEINAKSNISVTLNSSVVSFNGNSKLTSITINNNGKNEEIILDGVFISIGQIPQNKPFEKILNLDKYGYIIADEKCTTNADGIFVAGDCRTKSIRQVATAIGDGAVASVRACTYLDS